MGRSLVNPSSVLRGDIFSLAQQHVRDNTPVPVAFFYMVLDENLRSIREDPSFSYSVAAKIDAVLEEANRLYAPHTDGRLRFQCSYLDYLTVQEMMRDDYRASHPVVVRVMPVFGHLGLYHNGRITMPPVAFASAHKQTFAHEISHGILGPHHDARGCLMVRRGKVNSDYDFCKRHAAAARELLD